MAHDTPATQNDIRDLRDTIATAMRDGFSGVHERQDKTNGRVNAAHELIAEQRAKILNLESAVFGRRSGDYQPRQQTADPPPEDARGISQRDVQMFVAGAGLIAAVVIAAWKLLPILLKAGS